MKYIIEENGVFVRYAEAGNIAFSASVFQPVSTLTPEQREQFAFGQETS